MHVRYSFIEPRRDQPLKPESTIKPSTKAVILGFLAMAVTTAAFVIAGGS